MSDEKQTPKIFQSIADVTAEIVKDGGVSKDRKNQQQNYAFRGVEDFLNVLAPLLPKHHIVVVPSLVARELIERETPGDKPKQFYHALATYDFTLYSTLDGSSVTASCAGEAIDYADKAFNKTVSMAYKYAMMMTFCIPTHVEDVEDTDETTPEPAKAQPKPEPQAQAAPQQTIVKPAPKYAPPTTANPARDAFFARAAELSLETEAAEIARKHVAAKSTWGAALAELNAFDPTKQPA